MWNYFLISGGRVRGINLSLALFLRVDLCCVENRMDRREPCLQLNMGCREKWFAK